jgi:hypothetical protein
MLTRYIDFVTGRPRLVLAIVAGIVALASAGMINMTFRSDERVFFSDDSPQLQRLEGFEARYGQDDTVLLLVHAEQGDLYEGKHFRAMATMVEDLWNTPYVKRVDGPTNFQLALGDAQGMRIDHLWRLGDPTDAEAMQQVRSEAGRMPLLMGRLLSEDGRTGLIAVSLQVPQDAGNAVPLEVMSFVERRVQQYRADYPGLDIAITGPTALDAAFVEASTRDSMSLIPAMYSLFLVLLAVLLQAAVPVVSAFLVVSGAIACGVGVGSALGLPMTSVSVSAPFVISVVALCATVHLVFAAARNRRDGDARIEAVRAGLRRTAWPIFLTSATTAAGFFSLGFAEVPPFAHLGVFSGFGALFGWMLAMSVVPALLTLFPWHPRGPLTGIRAAFGRLGAWSGRRPWTSVAMVLVPAVAAAAFVTQNRLDDRYVHYFDRSFDFRQATDALHDHLGGFYKLEYDLPAGGAGEVSDPGYLRALDELAGWFREQPEVTHVESHADRIKMIHRAVRRGREDGYVIPDDKGVAAQLLALYEMQLPIGRDLSESVAADKSASRLTVSLKDLSTAEILDLKQRAAAWIETNVPRLEAGKQATGTAVVFANIGMRNIESMFVGTAVAFALIGGLVLLAFRSVSITAVSMVANVMPSLSALGAWGLLVGEVGMAVATIVATTLGLVVDDTIHIISAVRRHTRAETPAPDAIRDAMSDVGPGIAATTLCIAAGFFVLSFSGFQINAWIGLMTAVVSLIAFTFDLLFLPGALTLLRQRRPQPGAAVSSSRRTHSNAA